MSKVLQILGASTLAQAHIDAITYALRSRCGALGSELADAIVHDFENPEPSFRFDAMDLEDIGQKDLYAASLQLAEHLDPVCKRLLVSRLSAELLGLDPDEPTPLGEASQAETVAQRVDPGPETL